MKQLVLSGKIAACAAMVCGFAANVWASWTYDSGANTLSDDSGWVFNTSVVAEPEGIQLSSVKEVGDATEIDLRETNMSGDVPAIVKAGDSLFENKKTVTKVWLPETLTVVSSAMFRSASALLEVYLSSQTTSVGFQAFCWDAALVKVEPFLPETCTFVGSQSFYECKALACDLTLGKDGSETPVTIDGVENFIRSGITGVDIKSPVTAIPNNCFNSCDSILFVNLPDTLQSVGEAAFYNCTHLARVTPYLPASVTTIKWQAFDQCKRLVGELTIGGSGEPVTLGGYAFRDNDKITKLTLGTGVTAIPNNCFQTCDALQTLVWHDGITSIDNYAIQGCKALTTVLPSPIPAALASMGDQAFYDCNKLGGEVAIGLNGPVSISGAHHFRYTRVTKMTFGSGVTKVPDYFGQGNSALESIVFAPEVREIASYAFQECSGLTAVQLPEGLTALGAFAFNKCTNLETVEPFLPEGLTDLTEQVFYQCGKLQGNLRYAMGGAPATIRRYAMAQTKITGVSIGDGVTEIPEAAFYQCGELASVKLPANLQALGPSAFCEDRKLVTVEPFLPTTLSGTLSSTFQQCKVLKGDVVIGCDDETADPVCFSSLSFYEDAGITSITFGKNVPKIANSGGSFTDNAFHAMTGVKTVYFLGDTEWGPSEFNSWGAFQARLVVDKDSDYWNGFVANAEKCRAPTPEELEQYRAAYPSEPDPRAVTIVRPANQWIISYGMVNPGEKNVTVSATPKLFHPDTIKPAYGLYTNCGAALPFAMESPQFATDGLTLFECRGYKVETPTVTGWGNGVTTPLSGSGARTFSYEPEDDGSYRVSWVWEPAGYQAQISLPSDSSIGTVTCSDPGLEGYYAAGTTATFTAVPGTDVRFVRWHGSVPAGHETDLTIQVVMDGPKTLMPEFESPWVYANGELTDGFWVLNAGGTPDAIAVGKPKVSYDLGLLDLTKPVKDGGVIASIGYEAFASDLNLRELRLPLTLKRIEDRSFVSCSSLTNVVPFLPAGVTYVGRQAFDGCTALAADELKVGDAGEPVSLSSGYAFRNCPKIKKVTLGPDITTIPESTFQTCTELRSVTLPEGLTTVGQYAFQGNEKLETVKPFLPATVTSIGEQAFYLCSKLKSDLYLGTNGVEVAFAGQHQFNQTGFAKAVLGAGVKTISANAFYKSAVVEVEMAAVVTIGSSAFENCGSLRRAVLPETLENMPYGSCWACGALEDVGPTFLPPACTNVGFACFHNDGKLGGRLVLEAKKKRDIVFPSNVQFCGCPFDEIVVGRYQTTLPNGGFERCSTVKRVYFKGKPTDFANAFSGWGRQAILYLPRDNAEWMAMMADPEICRPWATLTRGEQDTYFDRFGPDAKPPFGLFTASAYPPNQWVEKWNPFPTGTKLILR